MKKPNQTGLVSVNNELTASWVPAIQARIGLEAFNSLTAAKKRTLVGIASATYFKETGSMVATEADMTYMTADNSELAANVANPVAGGHNEFVAKAGTKGSGDKQFLVGLCIAIAAKTIGLELVQTVPATSQNITIKFLNVKYNGGDLNNPADNNVHVVTLDFNEPQADLAFTVGTKYVVGKLVTGTQYEFIELTYVKQDRKGPKSQIFKLANSFTADVTGTTLSNITILGTGPAIGQVVNGGSFWSIDSGMTTLSNELNVTAVENTNAVENYVPNETTKGLTRTLTRSEADAGSDRVFELELDSDAYTIGNRTFNGAISRLQKKRLEEQGINSVLYLTAALKNEIAQEVNHQIISSCRAYGISNALEQLSLGTNYNTFIGPKTIATKAFSAIQGATTLTDLDGNLVASQFPSVDNFLATLEYENSQTIGTYLCMLITQACYNIGTDSRYGEGDAVVLGSSLAGLLAASSQFTRLGDKDVDMTASTGAKLSGFIGSIKVYVDVQIPISSPWVTVLRTNQEVKVDMPGIEGDNILVPGLAYLVKDLISSTELVPEGTGGYKVIIDSETDLIAVGTRPQAGYLTFAFDVQLPALTRG